MDYDDKGIGSGKPGTQHRDVKRHPSGLRPSADAESSLGARHDSLGLAAGHVGPIVEGLRTSADGSLPNGAVQHRSGNAWSPHAQAADDVNGAGESMCLACFTTQHSRGLQ